MFENPVATWLRRGFLVYIAFGCVGSGSSPKSCVKSLCSSFFLIRVLLCQANLAGPSV